MRIIVDQLPKNPKDCRFSKVGMSGLYDCKLEGDGIKCVMEFGLTCSKIGAVSEYIKQDNEKGEEASE